MAVIDDLIKCFNKYGEEYFKEVFHKALLEQSKLLLKDEKFQEMLREKETKDEKRRLLMIAAYYFVLKD